MIVRPSAAGMKDLVGDMGMFRCADCSRQATRSIILYDPDDPKSPSMDNMQYWHPGYNIPLCMTCYENENRRRELQPDMDTWEYRKAEGKDLTIYKARIRWVRTPKLKRDCETVFLTPELIHKMPVRREK